MNQGADILRLSCNIIHLVCQYTSPQDVLNLSSTCRQLLKYFPVKRRKKLVKNVINAMMTMHLTYTSKAVPSSTKCINRKCAPAFDHGAPCIDLKLSSLSITPFTRHRCIECTTRRANEINCGKCKQSMGYLMFGAPPRDIYYMCFLCAKCRADLQDYQRDVLPGIQAEYDRQQRDTLKRQKRLTELELEELFGANE